VYWHYGHDSYAPGTALTCDGLDNDCDGGPADEDFFLTTPDGAQLQGPSVICGVGECTGGITQCTADGAVSSESQSISSNCQPLALGPINAATPTSNKRTSEVLASMERLKTFANI